MLAAFYGSADDLEAGVDEAGRGSLAGPVVAAAVVWNPALVPDSGAPANDTGDTEAGDDDDEEEEDALRTWVRRIRDSKKLTRRAREKLRAFIEEHAVAWSVRAVPPARIDAVNILNATYEAMHGALDDLRLALDRVVVDGDRFRAYISPVTRDFVPHACVVDGDNKFLSVAAASILAKTHRDELMRSARMHGAFPAYAWDRNVGYGSAQHMAALRELGPCEHHRLSFAPCAAAAAAAAAGPEVTMRTREDEDEDR
jgi:ribonuclease HII